MDQCLSLARWHEQNHRLGGERSRALELLRLACGQGHGDACVELVTNAGATARDRAAPAAALAPRCARGDLCACFSDGVARTLTAPQSDGGVEVLSDACQRGALSACDSLELLAQICERDSDRAGPCARLLAGRPAPGERPEPAIPRLPAAALPASLEGCFAVPPAPRGAAPCFRAWGAVEATGARQGSTCPRDGSFDPGATFCFARDRYFVKPTGQPWDVRPVEWQASPDGRRFRAYQERIAVKTPKGTLMGRRGAVEELVVSGQEVLVMGSGRGVRIERIEGREAGAVRDELARLRSLEDVCRSAARCEKAIPGGLDLPPDDGLRSCEARAQAARAVLAKQGGREAAEKACP
jgi:hypothetical protein